MFNKVSIYASISTVFFLIAFLMFPLAAEKIISPFIIPVVLFWCILLIVGNFISGITYGVLKKWGKWRLIFVSAYNVILLYVLITLFAMAVVVVNSF